MAAITKNQSRAVIYGLFHLEGWLPSGTTNTSWPGVTMEEMQFDDPPLPSDPNFQKKKLAFEIQASFIRLGSAVKSPLAQLKNDDETLGELAQWCFENQEGA
jgi:hypothetical protein